MPKKRIKSANEEKHGKRKWWYILGFAILISAFLMFFEYATVGKIVWSIWPAAAMILFGVGISVLEGIKKKTVWHELVMVLIISLFVLVFDFSTNGAITWSILPAVAIFVFGVGFAVLDRYGRQ